MSHLNANLLGKDSNLFQLYLAFWPEDSGANVNVELSIKIIQFLTKYIVS
jgi:hypothetical protein